jgi:hypothetical protein
MIIVHIPVGVLVYFSIMCIGAIAGFVVAFVGDR